MNSDLSHQVAGVVLAGGQGTRLFPLTQFRCKPAVSFGGRYRLIDIPLSNSLNSKISQLFVISQYFASDLHHHITTTYPLKDGRIELLSPEETPHKKEWFEGTADAVRKNLDHLLKTSADYFLILSGDQLYNLDFLKMVDFAKKTNADLTIAALPVQESEARRMGVMKTNSSGKVTQFYEKPTDPATLESFCTEGSYLASMGIYVFKREVLTRLLQEEGVDFGRHLIPKQLEKGGVFAFRHDGYWVDIGTISSFYEANMALLGQKECLDTYDESNPIYTKPHNLPSPIFHSATLANSSVSQGSKIDHAEIVNSIIGVRSHIKRGTKISHSVILGNHFYKAPSHQHPPLPHEFSIGEDCLIERSIIDEHVKIGNRVRLTNKNKLDTWDGDGIYIRDGIIIVTTGTELPDGYEL